VTTCTPNNPQVFNMTNPTTRRDTMTTTPARRELLTLKEVAALLHVPVATLRYWRHLGTGPRSFRVGRGVRYHSTDVHAWINAKRRNGR